MIAIVFSMIRARRAQAVTLLLLAAVAVAAAVAGPVSTRATDAAAVRLEVANAVDRERSLSITSFTDPTNPQAASQFTGVAQLVSLPGFEVVRSGEIDVWGPVVEPEDPADLRDAPETRVAYRDRLCEYVTILSGRCLASTGEIVIGEQTALREGLVPGDVATVQAFRIEAAGSPGVGGQPAPAAERVPDGPPANLTVVGVYRPTNPADPYWSGQRYFLVNADGTRDETVFMSAATMAVVGHTIGTSILDTYAPQSVLTPQRLAGIDEELRTATASLSNVANLVVSTQLPALAQRVATSRDLASQLGPVAFIPLTATSLYVIFLAVGYGVFGRRTEIGLVTLRGISRSRRWLLANAEAVIPILVGAPVGYLLGHVGVGLVARLRLGSGDGTQVSSASLPYAGVALLIALVMALLGQRRALREPVVELLRGVSRGRSAWRALVVEALIGALAVVATLQLRSSSAEGITGLGLLVPGLLIAAVALLAARVNVLVTGFVARSALRRGLLGLGLSAVHLARRPGSQRLFVLLAVGSAILAFVAAGISVAARARDERATVVTAASRVLHLEFTDVRQLLAVTDEVDPGGAWAMAAVTVEQPDPAAPPVLALDTKRLAAVTSWRPEFGADPAAVAAALAPPAENSPGYVPPLVFDGGEVEIDIEVVVNRPSFGGGVIVEPLVFDVQFAPLAGGPQVRAVVVRLTEGRHVVRAPVGGCADGCEVVGFTIPNAQAAASVYLYGVRTFGESGEPGEFVISPQHLTDLNRWRVSSNGTLVPGPDSLSVRLEPTGFESNVLEVGLSRAPLPVPAAATAAGIPRPEVFGDAQFSSLDGETVPAVAAVQLQLLPRLGSTGILADIRYLERTLVGAPAADLAEIWLGPAAPPDAADIFRRAGLRVSEETSGAATRAALAREGPALALQFHLAAAAFGVLLALGGLGLVAAVDRRARAADLRALWVQGLRRRMARRAALWGYLSTVVLAAVTGLVGAAVAWAAAGDRLPIFAETSSALSPPRWPTWQAVLQPWALATLAMALAAGAAAWALRRAVARPQGNGGPR